MRRKNIGLLLLALYLTSALTAKQSVADYEKDRIKPYTKNPRYWQYKGEPVLLIGGTKDDNLFQIPDLKEHLDLLKSVGGNYIRNTMSSRDKGNVMPFAKSGDKYDLTKWNKEYWKRFENMLKWTNKREIITQIELWAIWDMWSSRWKESPWNPGMNINYTFAQTRLKSEYETEGGVRIWQSDLKHDFYFSVPNLSNDRTLLKYQQAFVDKILSYALDYDNVLYCMTNEIFKQFSPEWGWYWARYIKEAAQKQNKKICTAEMYQWPLMRHEQHKGSLDHHDIFDFEDISQNSGRYGVDENHWDNFRYIYNYISDHPRPINHVKTYGSAERHGETGVHDAREKFLRSIIGGAASMRFHRPSSGMGLNEAAQTTLKMIRRIEEDVKLWNLEVHMDLLAQRESDEAYLTAKPGEAYLLYFTNPGSVVLDLSKDHKTYTLKWMNITTGNWESITDWIYELPIQGGQKIKLCTPTRAPYIAVILAQ